VGFFGDKLVASNAIRHNFPMSIIQNMLGHITEFSAQEAQKEFQSILSEGEAVVKAFRLIRDQVIMTNFRMITVNKQGVTGTKQQLISIPYRSIKKFSKESAGLFDLDAELQIWLVGETEPMKWEFSRGVDINQVYAILNHYVVHSH
jgi:hypothetical protein